MSRNHVQPGNVIDVTLGATFAAGEPILVGTRVGVCLGGGVSGQTVSVAVDEVYDVAKLSTDAVTQGAVLYLDAANKRLTTTASGNTLAGYATKAAGSGVTTVNVKLNG